MNVRPQAIGITPQDQLESEWKSEMLPELSNTGVALQGAKPCQPIDGGDLNMNIGDKKFACRSDIEGLVSRRNVSNSDEFDLDSGSAKRLSTKPYNSQLSKCEHKTGRELNLCSQYLKNNPSRLKSPSNYRSSVTNVMDPRLRPREGTNLAQAVEKCAEIKALILDLTAQQKQCDKTLLIYKKVFGQEVAEAKKAFEKRRLESADTKDEVFIPPESSPLYTAQYKAAKAKATKYEKDIADLNEQLSLVKRCLGEQDRDEIRGLLSKIKGDHSRLLEENKLLHRVSQEQSAAIRGLLGRWTDFSRAILTEGTPQFKQEIVDQRLNKVEEVLRRIQNMPIRLRDQPLLTRIESLESGLQQSNGEMVGIVSDRDQLSLKLATAKELHSMLLETLVNLKDQRKTESELIKKLEDSNTTEHASIVHDLQRALNRIKQVEKGHAELLETTIDISVKLHEALGQNPVEFTKGIKTQMESLQESSIDVLRSIRTGRADRSDIRHTIDGIIQEIKDLTSQQQSEFLNHGIKVTSLETQLADLVLNTDKKLEKLHRDRDGHDNTNVGSAMQIREDAITMVNPKAWNVSAAKRLVGHSTPNLGDVLSARVASLETHLQFVSQRLDSLATRDLIASLMDTVKEMWPEGEEITRRILKIEQGLAEFKQATIKTLNSLKATLNGEASSNELGDINVQLDKGLIVATQRKHQSNEPIETISRSDEEAKIEALGEAILKSLRTSLQLRILVKQVVRLELQPVITRIELEIRKLDGKIKQIKQPKQALTIAVLSDSEERGEFESADEPELPSITTAADDESRESSEVGEAAAEPTVGSSPVGGPRQRKAPLRKKRKFNDIDSE